jgi:predicted RNA methylase
MVINAVEKQRQILQVELDKGKSREERNIMGQFSTPFELATDILTHAKNILPKHVKVRFLDPALGTGSFFSALTSVFSSSCIEAATGYEVDAYYGKPALKLWEKSCLNYNLDDFTKQPPPDEDGKYNLIIW